MRIITYFCKLFDLCMSKSTIWKQKRHSLRRSRKTMKLRIKKNRTDKKAHLKNKRTQINTIILPRRRKNTYLSTKTKKRIKGIPAPKDFRLNDNPSECLKFFSRLRNQKSSVSIKGKRLIDITLKDVCLLDYATISVFKSIIEELRDHRINVIGDFPQDATCRKMMINSGFLSHMFDQNGNPFRVNTQSDLLQFEKGTGILTENDSRKISTVMNDVASNLLGYKTKCSMLKSLLLEICGNTIEWSEASSQRWQLGIIYNDNNSVIITVTDIGKGILGTLFGRFQKVLKGLSKSDIEILYGAFEQKYGSSTKENNRNQGLRLVKRFHEEGCLKRLKVLTNNVFLDFDNMNDSLDLSNNNKAFGGTFFQWELDRDCIKRINTTIWN